jgi:hypothetical protein
MGDAPPYVSPNGRSSFNNWREKLAQSHIRNATVSRGAIAGRVGNLGDHTLYNLWNYDPAKAGFIAFLQYTNLVLWCAAIGAPIADIIAGWDGLLTSNAAYYLWPFVGLLTLTTLYAVFCIYMTCQQVTVLVAEEKMKQEWPAPPTVALFCVAVMLSQAWAVGWYGYLWVNQDVFTRGHFKWILAIAGYGAMPGLAWLTHEFLNSTVLSGEGATVPDQYTPQEWDRLMHASPPARSLPPPSAPLAPSPAIGSRVMIAS